MSVQSLLIKLLSGETDCLSVLAELSSLGILEAQISTTGAHYVKYLKQLDAKVEIQTHHVRWALTKYLNKTLSPHQLTEWARCVISIDSFHSPYWEVDHYADIYEPVWDILTELANPSIDGPVTPQRVEEYLVLLKKVENRLSKS